MRYDVTLKIDYEYSQPADNTRNLLRLLPGEIPGVQTIHDWTLALTPQPSEQTHFKDFFGNWVTSAVWHMPIEEVKIALTFQAERFPQSPLLSFATPLERMAQALAASPSDTPLPTPRRISFYALCLKSLTKHGLLHGMAKASH